MNIAICDDMESYNDKLYHCLEKYMMDNEIDGYSITPYTSGKELVGKYSRGLYDLIFLDIDMPELGGYETAEYITKLDTAPTQIGDSTVIVFIGFWQIERLWRFWRRLGFW